MKRQQTKQKDQTEKNNKRLRVLYVLLGFLGLFILIAGVFIASRELTAPDLYYVLLFELLGTTSLYMGGIFLCLIFLYLSIIITFKNPQRVKTSKVFTFALVGLAFLIGCIWLIGFTSQEFVTQRKALNDYNEGNWVVKDVYVTEYYPPDRYSNISLIESEEEQFALYWRKHFHILTEKMYRVTYLAETNVIIDIVPLDG